MEAFKGEKLGVECDVTLNRKLQEHGRDVVSL